MIEDPKITRQEREALDQLGRNFDALLARTPEQSQRADRRRFVLAGAMAATCLLALVVWAAWPGDSTVDSAQGDIADIAAQQDAPGPRQFVEAETITTLLVPGGGGRYYSNNVSQHSWLSMTQPGVVDARFTSTRPDARPEAPNVGRTSPAPVYRIAGKVYKPSAMAAFAKNPEGLIADIDAKASELAPRFRPAAKWKYLIDPLKANNPPLPSPVRAALIGELEGLRGVSETVEVRDPRGRDGLRLTLDDDSVGLTLGAIFDPENAQILYTDSVIKDPSAANYRDAKAGQTFASYLLVSSRVVDSAPRVVSKSK